MPRHGKQRSTLQQKHVQGMRRQVLALRSSSAANIIKTMDPRAASKQRKKDVKEINIQRRQIHTARNQEAKLKEKVNNQTKVINSSTQFGAGT
jgi:hypothetical protein